MALLRFLLTFGVLATLFSAPALAGEPRWILNNGDSAEKIIVGQGTFNFEFGLATILSTGTDCTVRFAQDAVESFEADTHPFFAVRYKYESKQTTAGLFFTTNELTNLSDKSYSSFPIVSDNTWRNAVVDMRKFPHGQWKGTITSFRFDPTNPSDAESKYALSRLGFFASEKEANDFLNAANDNPDFSMPSNFVSDGFRCYVPGGVLNDEFSRDDFQLATPPRLGNISMKGTREELVLVRREGSQKIIEPICDATSQGFVSCCVREKGPFSLEDRALPPGTYDFSKRSSERAVRFVLARELMTLNDGKFLPEKVLSANDAKVLADKLSSFFKNGKSGEILESLSGNFVGKTREEVAVLIMNAIRDGLGTNVNSEYSREYYNRERIRIGAWGNFRAVDFNDEYMKTYADCGFDFLLAMVAAPTPELLRVANKYGVEVYVNDGTYSRPLVGDAEFCDFPNYTGSFITDEPGVESYDKLASLCNDYKKATGKEGYINLLPMYANAAQLKYGASAAAIEYYDADPDLFRKYCAAFCDKFDTKYICTDIYPLNWGKEHKKTTYADYAESINVIASVAREYDREFWCFIQTFAWIPSKRTPNETEFRWQCYSMLSFGCKCILCWTYAGYKEGFPSLVDTQGRKTRAWDDARPVFWELRALSDEFVKYRNLGAFTHNCSDATPYLKISDEYKDFQAIQEIDCEQPLLVGCFEKKDDRNSFAFTLVNMSELQDETSARVRMKLNATSVNLYRRGVVKKVEPDKDGFFVFELETGDGVFVTLDSQSK